MNLELLIARKIHFNGEVKGKNITSPAIRIAIAGISIGLAVMILSVAIVIGFKHQIRDKVIGFGSHIQISNFDSNNTYETQPIAFTDSVYSILNDNKNIINYERFATKPGVLKTDSAFMAVVLKGVGEEYDWKFFQTNMREGEVIQMNDSTISSDVIVSKYIADKMNLKVGDSFSTYFVQDNVRARKFKISGIYETYFSDYDKLFILSDIRHVQRLNGWDATQVSGLEIMLDDFSKMDEVNDELYFSLLDKKDDFGNSYYVRSIKELNPQIFSWLDFIDMNVWIILALMSIVAAFTMISGLLIIILERTNMIGILKALGCGNASLRKIFMYVALFLVGKGLLWGNVIGLALCYIQKYLKVIKLDPESYYLDVVPVEIIYIYILLLNISTIVISMLILFGPSYIISKIQPAKSIRFE